MKKIVLFRILLFITIFLFIISCEQKRRITTKPIIVVSIPPLELILEEIVKYNLTIETMLPTGASPHTHEIVPADIKLLNSATMIFYVSDDLDAWICKYPTNAKSIRLIDYIKNNDNAHLLQNHNKHLDDKHLHSHIDPHFWLSPLMVKSIIDSVVDAISLIDTKNKKIYKQNANKFKLKLDSLHSNIEAKFASIEKNKTLFNAHNSFAYFTKEFGLKEFIAIEESPGKEITTKYFLDIVNKIKTSGTKCIFSEPQLNSKIIQTLANNNNLKIILLDPLNSYIQTQSYYDFILYNAEHILIGMR
jgi:zinc transport system substrate-binding protein